MDSMHDSCAGRTARSKARVVAMVAAVGLSQLASATVYSWNTGSGAWNVAANWSPNGVPTIDDTILIGNLPPAHNGVVMLGPPGFFYDYLEVSNGMTLDSNGGEIVSFDDVWIIGNNSRIIARPAGGSNFHDFQGELHIGAGAYFDMRDNVQVRLFTPSVSSGTITGRGTILSPLVNDGVIRPSNNGGIVLDSYVGGTLDLDGVSGNGEFLLDVPFSVLEVNALALTDSFSGQISLVPGSLLTMNIDEGWTADANCDLNVAGFNNPAAASQINGDALTFGGTMNIGAAEGRLRILSTTTFQPTAQVNIGATDGLQLTGAAIINGGLFTIGQGGRIDFDGPTTMQGGGFETPTSALSDGGVYLNGFTIWRGTTIFDGAARQNGDAIVDANSTINAGLFDMDGAANDARWDINANLNLDADQIGDTAASAVGGVLDIGNQLSARLNVHLTDPNSSWTTTNQLNLVGFGALTPTRVTGSPMRVLGNVLLASGSVQISADTTFLGAGAQVSIAQAASVMRLNAKTVVEAGADFAGAGTMQNSTTGQMRLGDGASLGTVGLLNAGRLSVGEDAGVASVDRLECAPSSAWNVSLGGYNPATEHDQLIVSGGAAALAGSLEVSHLDLGAGEFRPNIGDEFVILTALNGVTGSFAANPVSSVGPLFYQWTVIYEPNTVILRLDSIACLGDVNGDGLVDFQDLNLVLSSFNTMPGDGTFNPKADIDGDGVVSFTDLNIILAAFNAACR